jgi:hypothetical protein
MVIQGSGRDLDQHAARYELTDFEWSVIEPLLPKKPRRSGRVGARHVFWNDRPANVADHG